MACKTSVKPEETVTAEKVDSVDKPVVNEAENCYLAIVGRDSILMEIVIEKTSAIGHLHYRFFEKDKSGGNIFGVMRGDTLVADYKFIAEGMESEREVAFLKRGDEFIEGYGESVDKGGRMVFKNVSMLKFEGSPMKKTDCAALTQYFHK